MFVLCGLVHFKWGLCAGTMNTVAIAEVVAREGPCKPHGCVNIAASPVSINIHMRKPVCPHLIFDLLEVKLHHLILFN